MLNVKALLQQLEQYQVRYVLFGSLAAIVYGADLKTTDMDICHALDEENLARIAELLVKINARPRVVAGWMTEEESLAWKPSPLTIEQLDHNFQTDLGLLDVCPYPFGSAGKLNRFNFDSLDFRAETLTAYGFNFRLAHIDDVLASKLSARRKKDEAVTEELKRVQCRIIQGKIPTNIESRLDSLLT